MNDFKDFWIEVLLPAFSMIFLLILGIVLLVCIPVWFSSCKSAEVYNKINNTSFTCSDFFWAGDQINAQSQTIKLK